MGILNTKKKSSLKFLLCFNLMLWFITPTHLTWAVYQYTELLAQAYDINDSGVVVGGGGDGDVTNGFIYKDGSYTELLPPVAMLLMLLPSITTELLWVLVQFTVVGKDLSIATDLTQN